MTNLTDIRPMNPLRPVEAKRHRWSPWPWVAAAAIVSPILVVVCVWLVNGLPAARTNVGIGFFGNVNPNAQVWHPNPQNAGPFCGSVAQLPLSDPMSNVLFAGITAEQAPNLADRKAIIAYYDDVRYLRPNVGDLAAVKATCPS